MKDFYFNSTHSRFNQKKPVVIKWCMLLVILLGASNNVAAQRMYRYATNIFNMDMSASIAKTRMVLGDFDNDGDKDILYQNGNTAGIGFGYFRNNGNSTFTDFPSPANGPLVGTPFASIDFTQNGGMQIAANQIHVFDYDGDGDDDIIDRELTTSILKNNGGVFAYTTDVFSNTIMAMVAPSRLVHGDFDNDGDQDILFQNANTPGLGFFFVKNIGGGNYAAPISANDQTSPFENLVFSLYGGQGISPNSIHVVDYDGDGDVDIIDREGNSETGISVWKNNAGKFEYLDAATDPFSYAKMPMPVAASRLQFADFDDDGDIDVLYQDGSTEGTGFHYLKNNGAGVFAPTVTANHVSSPFHRFDFTMGGAAGQGFQMANYALQFMDYDSDGDLDVLDREGGAITLWQQVGTPPIISSSTPSDNAVGVGLNPNITLIFDQAVTKNTGNIYIVRVSNNAVVETIAIGSPQVTGSGTTWMIDPSVTFFQGVDYAIRYDADIFRNIDLVGNEVITDNTTLNFTTLINSIPVIGSLNGDAAAYSENSPPSVLDQGTAATVTDTDSPDFNGGYLRVSISSNYSSGDIVGIGSISGITRSFSTVYHNLNAIGTYSGGQTGTDLLISFTNPAATPTSISALLTAITFSSSSNNPSILPRTISYSISDGDGGLSVAAAVTVAFTALNDPPVISGILPIIVVEDVSKAMQNISISDLDVGTGLLDFTFSVPNGTGTFSAVSFGNVTVTGTGTNSLTLNGTTGNINAFISGNRLQFNPALNYNTDLNITLSLTDNGNTGDGGSQTRTGSIYADMSPMNDAPTITTPGSIIGQEDVATNITGISFADVDAVSGTATASFSVPSGTFTAIDGGSVTVAGSGTGNITLSGTIADMNTFIAAASLVYTPVPNNDANVMMTVKIDDGGNTGGDPGGPSATSEEAAASVTLTLAGQNDAPVITATTPVAVFEDASKALNNISISDIDAGSGNVTFNFSIPAGTGTLVAVNNGGVTVTVSNSINLTLTGTVTNINAFITQNRLQYFPAANLNGNVILSLSATDNGNTGTGGAQTAVPVNITLEIAAENDTPGTPAIAAPFIVEEDVATIFPTVTFSDVDAGTSSVTAYFTINSGTFSALSGSGVTVANSGTGNMLLSGTLADINAFSAAGNITYTPVLNYTSSAISTTLTLTDNGNTGSGGSKSALLTILTIITAVNDAPEVTIPTAQSVNINSSLTFNVANGNVPSITDVDLNPGMITVALQATNGVITLGQTAGLAFTLGDGTEDAVMEFTGSLVNVNNAMMGLVFKPNANYFGPASIQITANDQGNTGTGGALTDVEIITINVQPTTPLVTNVTTSMMNGRYKPGDVIPVTATFSMPVAVTGIPQLLLETGTTDRNADYFSGSGTNTITFNYTVQNGDVAADLDYASVNALTLNGGTIRNAANMDATLTLATPGAATSLSANNTLIIDGIVPSVTSVNVPANATYIASQVLTFTVSFSELVAVTGTPTLALQIGSRVVQATYVPALLSSSLAFSYTVVNTDEDTDGIVINSLAFNGGTIRDAAGNDAILTLNNVGSTVGILVDAVIPTITSVDVPSSKLWKEGEVLHLTVHYSEPVIINGGTPSIPVTIGAAVKAFTLTGGAGTNALTFSYTILTGDLDRDGITPAASITLNGATIRDAANNNADLTLSGISSTTGILVDAVLPVITTGQVLSINENSAAGTAVGTLTGNDPGSTGTLAQWAITTNVNPDADANPAFAINAATGAITVNDAGDLDYETNTTFTLSVRVSDGVNNSIIQTITINVANQPEPPLDINLSNALVYENNAVNVSVGNLSSTSTEPGTTYTFTLVPGAGSEDNATFSITGNTLTGLPAFNFETKSTYNIRVRSTTQHNVSIEKSFVVTVGDVNEVPTLDVINDQQLCVIATDQEVTLSGITPGPETAQTVTITVDSDHPGLFTTLAVSNNKLRMRFTAGSNGTALVTVTVKDIGGTLNNGTDQTTRTFRVNVTSIAPPTITSNISGKISKGKYAELTATGGDSYLWDNMPGIISGHNTATLLIRPLANTTFRVVAANVQGCTASAQINIETEDDYKVNSANILTPNGDGKNDRFMIDNIDSYPNNELKIFDQSGRLIYSKRGYQNEWDGRLNGRPLEEGTCYFMLDFGPNLPKVKGFITIIRDKR